MDDENVTLTSEQERQAKKLHSASTVIDCSSVIKMEPAHFDRAFSGGVTASNHTVTHPGSDLSTALQDIAQCRQWIEQNSDKALLARTAADIAEAKRSGHEAIILGPQNAELVGGENGLLDALHAMGVRVLQLTYQRQNLIGSGCGERRDAGLSDFGRTVVARMDDLGIVVDLSHCGQVTGADAIGFSKNPVIFSHAHPNMLSPHIRAKDDDLLRALADNGGVIGITGLSTFLYDPERPSRRPGLRSFARHVAYVAELVGIDHVGIGLDFDETITRESWEEERVRWPSLYGWEFDDRRAQHLTTTADAYNITRALVAEGFSETEITKVLGSNFLRVFETVWHS